MTKWFKKHRHHTSDSDAFKDEFDHEVTAWTALESDVSPADATAKVRSKSYSPFYYLVEPLNLTTCPE